MLDDHDAQAVGAMAAMIGTWHALGWLDPGITPTFQAVVALWMGVPGWRFAASAKHSHRSMWPGPVAAVTLALLLGLSVFAVAATTGTGLVAVDHPVAEVVDEGPGQADAAPPGAAAKPAEDGRSVSDRWNETRVERLVLEYTNDRRGDRDYPDLQWNERASRAADRHAEDMAERGYFNHTSLDGETQSERYSFCQGGENAAKTYADQSVATENGIEEYNTEDELARAIVRGWMNSPPHRERGIYGQYWESAGAGVAIDKNGTVYAVLGFCQL